MKSFSQKRELFLLRLWQHSGKFEGIKCKTCLPLDWVQEVFDEVFNDEINK